MTGSTNRIAKRPRAVAFDVFGTVVDWRASIARAVAPMLVTMGRTDVAPAAFADGWRSRYQPAMAAVREGRRPFAILDTLHRETLEDLLVYIGIDPAALGESALADLVHAWHRLDPWPDAVAGIARLRRAMPVVTLSNGNVALMVDLSRHAGIDWDAILGAEVARAYKPDPQAYLATAAMLGLDPADLCLAAAHHSDLAAARRCGLMTAYVDRPMEYGGRAAPDRDQAQDWDWTVDGIGALAAALGC